MHIAGIGQMCVSLSLSFSFTRSPSFISSRYPQVEKVVQVEIDSAVPEVAKEFLPEIAAGYEAHAGAFNMNAS